DDGTGTLRLRADPARLGRPGDEVVPLGPDGRLLVNYVGPPGSVPRRSFAEALRAARAGAPIPGIDLKGAVVVIGSTYREFHDSHATPFAGAMYGPEVHAGILATLSDGAFLHEPRAGPTLALLLLAGLLLGALAVRARAGRLGRWGGPVAGAAAAGAW